jgi:tetratricopeptide (TPR) repeat protein
VLGGVLERARPPQAEEAIRAYSVAWGRQPELAGHDLAHALERRGRGAEAEAVWRDLVGRRRENGHHLGCYGRHLKERGRGAEAKAVLARAVAALREAIRLKPDDASAHTNLGNALSESGDVRGAIAAYREAIRLNPDYALAHCNLGGALNASGDVRGAIAACREAIRLEPDLAEAHCNLGHTLQRQGQYAESLAELRLGHELGSKRPDWRYPSAAWVARAERLAALAERLPAVLAGTARPADAAERLAFAQMLYDAKRHAAAARLWSEALAADPKLGDDRGAQHRYDAACAAALAAAGRAEGEPPPDAAARAELRRKALDWLRAELAAWSKLLDSGDPKARAAIAPTLQHWKEDSDLAGVRDGDALATLPADERRAWEAFWKDVDALLKRFGAVDPETAGIMAVRGLSLIQQGKWAEAEPVLRECLAIREKVQPDEWSTFNTRSLLGGSLLGQKRYAEAEPLIVSGYEGMKAREARIPPPGMPRLAEGAERVIRLYEEWGKKDKAAEWRTKLPKPTDATRNEP